MAQINLDSGESFTIAGGVNTISGSTTGGETVTILGGVTVFTADFNAGGDRVVLAGSVSQYTFQRSGSSVVFRGPNGTVVTFPAPNPNLAASSNPVISFANGGDYMLDSTPAGIFTLSSGPNSYTILTTPSTVIIEPPAPVALKIAVTDVTEGGTIVATFTLQQAVNREIRVDVATFGGTATSGADYVPVSQTLVFAPFQTIQVLTVATIDDFFGELPETVLLRVSPDGFTPLTSDSRLSATIIDNDAVIVDWLPLTTGRDVFVGGNLDDRIVGATDATLPFKMLSSDDVISGGAGNDMIELTNGTTAAIAIADADFAQVTSVERLVTNYTDIALGANAARAGIVALDTRVRTDALAAQVNAPAYASQIDLSMDGDANGVADFTNPLTAILSNSGTDTVRLQLAASGGSTIDTGTIFQHPARPVPTGPIDSIVLERQFDPVRVTMTAVAVGTGSAFDADGRTLAVRLQAQDATGALIGQSTRFDDEGITFTGARFIVDDASGLRIGSFARVMLGTALGDQLEAWPGDAYINGGDGNDFLTGGDGRDTLIGGAGFDTLTGGLGADMLSGGTGADRFRYTDAAQSTSTGYDTIVDFEYGIDTIDLPGSYGAIVRVTGGVLDAANFDAGLAAALAGQLVPGGAVLFTPSSGDLAGATFLVADINNGAAGYQPGIDYVIRLGTPPVAAPDGLIV